MRSGGLEHHEDDWESFQVRVNADGSVDSRASSHHGYNYDGGGIGGTLSDLGLRPRPGWGASTGRTYVSGGSHAGHVHQDGELSMRAQRRVESQLVRGHGSARGAEPWPPELVAPTRWTPAGDLELIPIETLGAARRTAFAISPPWRKPVYRDPEDEGT